MDTLKTAVVVVLLLAVLYGVYVKLNQPDQNVPEEIAWAAQNATERLQLDFGPTADSAAGVTASVGDAAPWSSDQAAADMHSHDHTSVGEPGSPGANGAQAGYGQSFPAAEANQTVAAPQLITATEGSPAGSAGWSPPSGGPESYVMPPANLTDRAADPAGGYDARSAYPPNQTADAAAVSAPAVNSNASVYAPAPPNLGAPSGSYGDPSGLSGNPQMIAPAAPPVGDSYAESAPSADPPAQAEISRIESVLETARGQIEQGQYYEALLSLSFAYNAPGLSPEESQQLQAWLDPLAGKVIYSKEHLIGAPYQLQAGETLQSVAAKHKVPWQLLANINGLRDPATVQPGMTIKVVPGPFHAEVDVANNSLTLFAGRLYAGRFAITVNGSNLPTPGEYQVNDKQPGHSFYAGNAQTLAPQDPQNPYGGVWIDLGGNIAIHGTSDSPGQSERLGSISLASKDANDLYGILSLGSNVVIRR